MAKPIVRLAVSMCLVATATIALAAPAYATVNQVSGEASDAVTCDGNGFDGTWDYVIPMTGDLQGCGYGVVQSSKLLPSGVYHEIALETFVGTYQGGYGTFEMIEDFITKDGADWGRCHHPIVRGSGTGAFEGVSGRLDFRDDYSIPRTTYKGHLKFG